MNQIKTRLQIRLDKRDAVQAKREQLFAEADGGNLSETDQKTDELYRSEIEGLDAEITQLAADAEAQDRADEMSKKVRRAVLNSTDGIDITDDGVPVYRSFIEYAKDQILARSVTSTGELAKLARNWGGEDAVRAAVERLDVLKRTPATTLSSDVPGLSPSQHIDQIYQMIDNGRPIVQQSERAVLDKLTLTFPRVDQGPVVAVQGTQKTEAGNQGLDVSMQTTNASTYLGGGNVSWQAANFTTPNALDLWFRWVTGDYALKTETDAATVVSAEAFLNVISSPLGATPTFADFMTAVGKGAAKVYSESGRDANVVYMSPDRYWYLFGTTSAATAQFTSVSGDGVGPLRFIKSRGLNAGEIIVGDSKGNLVGESEGAPVELRIVEPAIGGFEVGLIGLFESVIVDPGSFSLITTAS